MNSDSTNFKKDGFDGQKKLVLPKSVISKFCLNNSLINKAFVTDIGYYPKAKYHYMERPKGAQQNVLIYCVEGRGEIIIEQKASVITAGNFFLIPNGKPHTYRADPENPWTIYWCHFSGEQTDRIIQQINDKYGAFKAGVSYNDARIDLFEKIFNTLEIDYSFESVSYANLIFIQFLSLFLFAEKLNPSFIDNDVDLIQKSIKFMEKNMDKSLTINDLTNHINVSPSHYSSVFKKKTGFSPIEYLNRLKIHKACYYLQFTNLRIKEIAYKVGIDDQYYFSRLFNKTMEFSPSVYREQNLSLK
ncbi:AraC family transcriptional regulator [Pedobacter sp. SD-b]|uniref:AraC family transcriptional regulator n=1 Tax=Pedobacter segetis TaxID=2793069 RepID=A0ABS1BGE1_9SPHI|nr:AraC family transcriptional regulator [Pedobacter segetis]MBK0381931.1 AraC family transcriptional regulator [Pedobacter segetis]